MTLLTESPQVSPYSASVEGGGSPEGAAVLDFAPLEVPVEWTEFCYACDRSCTFVALSRCAEGLRSECSGCGSARIAPFTRMNSEVA
jgi:hypothetical protein